MTKDEALRLALEALETSMYPQQKQLQAITAIKAALEAKDERHIPIESWAIREEQVCPKKVCWYPYDCEDGRCVEAENNVFLSKAYQKEKNCE